MAGQNAFRWRSGAPVLFFTAVAVVGGTVWLRPSAAEGPAAYTTDYSAPASPHDIAWQGAVSCSSTACHGKDAPIGSKGTEYRTFLAVDPHRNAYKNFELAALIERNFKKRRSTAEAKPLEESVCLNCHGMNVGKPAQEASAKSLAGAGCEACHGPARNWLTTHYLTGWQQLSDSEKDRQGMHPTKNLVYRAQACVDCHVGTADREVNHDLMACGHPRLNFEYSAYLAMYPKHWSERSEQARYPDLEARAWAVGQVTAARAALDLLASRASRASSNKAPWPEFVEYDCYACHHDLKDRGGRRDPGKLGTLPWGTWYTPMLNEDLARLYPGADAAAIRDPLKKLDELMTKPYPAPTRVTEQAKAASDALAGWLQKIPAEPYPPRALGTLLQSLEKEPARANWDEEAQRYLAAVALDHTLSDLDPRALPPRHREQLKARLKKLEFLPGFDSPNR